ncbi:c-type cytochrome [Sphingomonas sp. TX0543]|uniref:c-type cytochrome n=1 Tax=Sphingomonas sp. TX0543 TaxID=3399682 RepID=UPI003AFAA2FC
MGSYGALAAGAAPASGSTASVASGKAFAQAHCSGCHAVLPDRFSPNPDAPPFENVVAKEGLTGETLTYWLRHSHNFPEIMNFEVADDQVDDLSAYMLTLRPPPTRRR